ncbi:MAG: PRC-barrel domain-containing protein [Trueperaceae bacterium]
MATTMNRTNIEYRQTLSAGTLIGDKVTNSNDANLGNLKEIMLDVDSGRVAYAVLETGSLLGMGGKLLAIPFDRFRVDEQHHKLILDVAEETLKNAEGFDKNNWPDTTSPDFAQRIHTHYGSTPYWERR